MTQNLAARGWWEVTRRDDSRGVRRLCRKHGVDGIYRLDPGALLDALFHCRAAQLSRNVDRRARHRMMVPGVQSVLLDGRKPLCGLERLKAQPTLWCGDEARRRLGGCKVQQVHQASASGEPPHDRVSGSQARSAPIPWPRIS